MINTTFLYASAALALLTTLALPTLPTGHRGTRLAVLASVSAVLLTYFAWRTSQTVLWQTQSFAAFYTQFILAIELLWLADVLHGLHFYAYASRQVTHAVDASLRQASVDVVIASYNEPEEILEKTLLCARRLVWSGPVQIYVLDDGKRDWLAALCARLGAHYLSRPDNSSAKAGNINHALDYLHGDFALLLDADFLVAPHAIDRLIAPMANPRVAVVQAPQDFYSPDPIQRSLGLQALSPTDQTQFFNGILQARDQGQAAFFCGTGGLLRVKALKEIDGFPTESVTEDIFLTLKLQARGWQSVTIDEAVATGLSPLSIDDMIAQRQRWGEGAVQMNAHLWRLGQAWKKGLGWAARLKFFPVYWVISYPVRLMSLLVPQLCLLLGWQPLVNAPMEQLLLAQGSIVLLMLAVNQWLAGQRTQLMVSQIWHDLLALRLTPVFLLRMLKPSGQLSFAVTPKSAAAKTRQTGQSHQRTYRFFDTVVSALVALTGLSLVVGLLSPSDSAGYQTSLLWAGVNLLRLWLVRAVLRREQPSEQEEVRVPAQLTGLWIDGVPAQALGDFHASESTLHQSGTTGNTGERDLSVLSIGSWQHIGRTDAQGRIHFHHPDSRGPWLSALVAGSLALGRQRLQERRTWRALTQTLKASIT